MLDFLILASGFPPSPGMNSLWPVYPAGRLSGGSLVFRYCQSILGLGWSVYGMFTHTVSRVATFRELKIL